MEDFIRVEHVDFDYEDAENSQTNGVLSDVNLTVLSAFAGRGDATLEGTTLTIGAQTSVVLK